MVSGEAEDREEGGGGDAAVTTRGDNPLRLVGYLKANKLAAYVLAVMLLMHLSNQFNRSVWMCLLHSTRCTGSDISSGIANGARISYKELLASSTAFERPEFLCAQLLLFSIQSLVDKLLSVEQTSVVFYSSGLERVHPPAGVTL